jgi:hypothetical protein
MSKYPNLLPWVCPAGVLSLINSWDAWVKGQTAVFGVATNMIDDPGAPTSITTRYGYRAPRKSDGSAYPDNWYLLGSSEGDAAEQAVFLDQQEMLGAVGAMRMILWYPNRADVSVGPVPDASDIYDASVARYLAMTTANQNLSKFCLSLQPAFAAYDGNNPGTWGNYTAFVNSWVTLALLEQYLKVTLLGVPNRPVFGMYYSGISNDWHLNLARVTTLTNAITAAGLGPPVYMFLGTSGAMATRVTASNTLGAQYFTGYLPGFGAGHQPWKSLDAPASTGCKAYDNPSGLNAGRALEMSHCVDNRPRNSANPWTDLPTYTELEQFERDRYATARSARRTNPNAFLSRYSACEIDEAMVFFPSEQTLAESVNSPARGIFLDAMANVRNRTFPSTYTDAYMAWTFHADVGASLPAGWAIVQDLAGTAGGLTGSDQYAVIRNTTTTDPRTWTTVTTRYRVYGTLGPGLGHIGFSLDGAGAVDVNQDDGGPTTRYSQLLYDSGPIANTSHTLAIARISGQAEFSKVRAGRSR